MTEQVKPKRIQRKRTKGWSMPENSIYIGRPTKFGNPFKVGSKLWEVKPALLIWAAGLSACPLGQLITPEMAVKLYRVWIKGNLLLLADVADELPGKDLVCWCRAGDFCHGDVLLEIANS